jgi:hypothetical protein
MGGLFDEVILVVGCPFHDARLRTEVCYLAVELVSEKGRYT